MSIAPSNVGINITCNVDCPKWCPRTCKINCCCCNPDDVEPSASPNDADSYDGELSIIKKDQTESKSEHANKKTSDVSSQILKSKKEKKCTIM